MRLLVPVLFACMPISASTIEMSVATCNGVSYQATDYAACGSSTTVGPFAAAYEGFVSAGEWGGGDSSASFTADYVLTVTGGSGSGFMDPNRRVEEGRLAGTYWQPAVSLPRSSNWTCPFRTSSFPTGFTAAHTRAVHTT